MSPVGDGQEFRFDVFLSFDSNNEQRVRAIRDQFREAGLRTFFAPDDLNRDLGRDDWKRSLFDALRESAHLAVYCSTAALTSEWVRDEITLFKEDARASATVAERRIIVLPDENLREAELKKRIDSDELLKELIRPKTVEQAVLWLTANRIMALHRALGATQTQLSQAQRLARQSFDYYRHAGFWRPFSRSDELHVFTCGRDIEAGYGRAARTNIDKWDYRAAVDITHYIGLNYRSIRVEIEQPVSKRRIDEDTRLLDLGDFTNRLSNKNCVVIGSPDVSDFAEITLAKILGVPPYSPAEVLKSGFRIIKDSHTFSTFYEATSAAMAQEGIHLTGRTGNEMFTCSNDRSYGVMVLADNPFSSPDARGHNHILILAGHTGISTRAISMLLTEEEPWCLDEFYKLDQAVAVKMRPVAVVVEVNYVHLKPGDTVGDDRQIPPEPGSIRFVCAVELRPGTTTNTTGLDGRVAALLHDTPIATSPAVTDLHLPSRTHRHPAPRETLLPPEFSREGPLTTDPRP